MKNRTILGMIVLCILASSGAAAGQPFPPVPGPDRDGADGMQRDETRKKVEAIRVARLTEALNLDERTVVRFIPAVTALEMKRRTLLLEHRRMMMEIRRELQAPSPDAGRLKADVEKIAIGQRELAKLREKEQETVREHLTTEQQARYLLFQEDFLSEIQGIVSGMRDRGRVPGGEGRLPPGPPNRQ